MVIKFFSTTSIDLLDGVLLIHSIYKNGLNVDLLDQDDEYRHDMRLLSFLILPKHVPLKMTLREFFWKYLLEKAD